MVVYLLTLLHSLTSKQKAEFEANSFSTFKINESVMMKCGLVLLLGILMTDKYKCGYWIYEWEQ
jgi:hypothetical protein